MYEYIQLKDLSWQILQELGKTDGVKSSDIAEKLNLKVRQVDAALTKSLVRYGLAERRAQLSRVQKKQFSLIFITPVGERYIEYRNQKDAEQQARFKEAKEQSEKEAERRRAERKEELAGTFDGSQGSTSNSTLNKLLE